MPARIASFIHKLQLMSPPWKPTTKTVPRHCTQTSPHCNRRRTGLTSGIETELDRALTDHELVEIKVSVGDREADAVIEQLVTSCGAELVQKIVTRLRYCVIRKTLIQESRICKDLSDVQHPEFPVG